jgi:cytochrome c-type biogenesis protein CcmH
MRALVRIALLAMLVAPTLAHAVTPDEILKDPALETRARNLSRELRCMVCQNQSIDDSEAPLAKDLRVLVRERLSDGDSDKQVLDFLVLRYGEFVLLKPPFEWHTLLLWGVSPTVLLIGIFALVMVARRRQPVVASTAALSQAEQGRLSTLVGPAAADH